MMLAQKQIRERLAADAQVLLDTSVSAEAQAWLDTYENAATNTEAADALIAALENAELDGEANDAKVDFLKDKDYAARSINLSSAVTVGLTISVSAVLTM